MTAQLIPDMPFDDYLAHPALSASGMKRLLDTPARFKVEQADTPAMKLGRLIHAIAFDQPHNYTVKDWDGRTTIGKKRAAEAEELGLEIVSGDDWHTAHGIANALRANKLAASVLYPDGVRHEVSAFWTDEETGVELKCRFDALGPAAIGDLKSTPNARPDSVARSAADFGYFVAAAQYRAGAEAVGLGDLPFYIVGAEKTAPYFPSVVGINAVDLELADALRRKAIRLYADCLERDVWPEYTDAGIAYPPAPSWWRYMAEEETGLYEIEVA